MDIVAHNLLAMNASSQLNITNDVGCLFIGTTKEELRREEEKYD